MNKLILFACVLTIGVFFNSCKDDDRDETAPIVSITSPVANATYAGGDTMSLMAIVTDNEELANINISSDLNFVGLNDITTFDSAISHTLNYNIILNAGTPAAAYTITVTGTDAEGNEGSGSVSITVQ